MRYLFCFILLMFALLSCAVFATIVSDGWTYFSTGGLSGGILSISLLAMGYFIGCLMAFAVAVAFVSGAINVFKKS